MSGKMLTFLQSNGKPWSKAAQDITSICVRGSCLDLMGELHLHRNVPFTEHNWTQALEWSSRTDRTIIVRRFQEQVISPASRPSFQEIQDWQNGVE